MLIFALDATRAFGARIAALLGVSLAAHDERRYEDGEASVRPLVNPAGEKCVVVQSLHADDQASSDDKLVRLLMLISALRDHGAQHVTAVAPYLAYSRQDRRTRAFDPVPTRVVAQLFEAAGCDALLTLEAHNLASFDNAFRIRALSLSPNALFTERVKTMGFDGPLAVASPDVGGVKRAQLWREMLEQELERPVRMAIVEKRRVDGAIGGGPIIAGDVEGASVLIVDDMIATFATVERAADALLRAGALRVIAFAAHGLFAGPATDLIERSRVDRVIVTDTVSVDRMNMRPARERVEVLPAAALFARALEQQQLA